MATEFVLHRLGEDEFTVTEHSTLFTLAIGDHHHQAAAITLTAEEAVKAGVALIYAVLQYDLQQLPVMMEQLALMQLDKPPRNDSAR